MKIDYKQFKEYMLSEDATLQGLHDLVMDIYDVCFFEDGKIWTEFVETLNDSDMEMLLQLVKKHKEREVELSRAVLSDLAERAREDYKKIKDGKEPVFVVTLNIFLLANSADTVGSGQEIRRLDNLCYKGKCQEAFHDLLTSPFIRDLIHSTEQEHGIVFRDVMRHKLKGGCGMIFSVKRVGD